MKKVTIHTLSGIPASGKSTLVGKMVERFKSMDNVTYVVICPDDIREELGDIDSTNMDEYRARECKTWAIAKGRLKGAIDLGIDHVVFDAQMRKRRDRKMFFKSSLTEDCVHTVQVLAWVLDTPYETALVHNQKRKDNGGRFVPEDVIKRNSTEFVIPTTDEGFDKVTVITPEG